MHLAKRSAKGRAFLLSFRAESRNLWIFLGAVQSEIIRRCLDFARHGKLAKLRERSAETLE
jgi:hypothetical protein